MKIADYGKAITSYIQSPTKSQKDKSKLRAGLLEEYLGDQLDYQKAVDEGFQGTEEEYRRYKATPVEDRTFLSDGTPPPRKPKELKDLFKKIDTAVLAVRSNTIPPEFIVPNLEKITQEYISDGLISGENARKFAIERKDYYDNFISENAGETVPAFDFDNEGKAIELSQEQITERINERDGGRIKAADGIAVQTLDPRFPTKDVTGGDRFIPLDIPGGVLPPLAIGAGAKRLKDIFFSKDKGDDKKEIVPSDQNKTPMKQPDEEPPVLQELAEDVLIDTAINRLRKKEMDVTKRDARTALARDLDLAVTKSGMLEIRKGDFLKNRLQTLKDKNVNFDGYYSIPEIANLLGTKSSSGIGTYINDKNIPFVKKCIKELKNV